MRIPNITLELNNEDIIVLLDKLLDRKKLNVTNIVLQKNLKITGHLPVKAINFPFCCELSIISVYKTTIKIKLLSFGALNVILPSKVKDLALNKFMSLISIEGVSIEGDIISVELLNLCKEISISQIDISKLYISNNSLILCLNDISTTKPLKELLASVV